MRVLIVDDNQSLLEAHKELLEGRHEADYFNNARDAFEAYVRNPQYDLVITDLSMPKKSGEGLLFDIFHFRPSQKMAVLSAYTEDFRSMPGMQVRVFTKPKSIFEVLQAWA